MSHVIKGISLYKADLSKAKDYVPPEFLIGWEWFEKKSGKRIDRLPFGKGRPEGMPMPLARQAAIHCPSYPQLPSKGAGKKRYALSVYSVGQAIYPDGDKQTCLDGTWKLRYHDQRGNDPNQDYNELMLNCLHDGVPLGVMVKSPRGGYDVLGLAIVEEYRPSEHVFLLHGPAKVSPAVQDVLAEKVTPSTSIVEAQHTPAEVGGLAESPAPQRPSGRNYAKQSTVKRPNDMEYARFRTEVYDAYEGACAITDYAIPEILDAAFIEPYQNHFSLVVSNGILLRADVCRLFDANLLVITPGTHIVSASKRLAGSGYVRLNGCELRMPVGEGCMPDDKLLEKRYRVFCEREE